MTATGLQPRTQRLERLPCAAVAADFRPRALAGVAGLAAGEVVSYGDVAAQAGTPGAARAVGAVLAGAGDAGVPWWRVVTSTGRLVPGHEVEHARRLRAEGVEVVDGRVRRPQARQAAMDGRRPKGS